MCFEHDVTPLLKKFFFTFVLKTEQAKEIQPSDRLNNDSEDDFHTGCRNASYNQQQSFSGLHKPGRSTIHIDILVPKM